jgi:hypothetical protein
MVSSGTIDLNATDKHGAHEERGKEIKSGKIVGEKSFINYMRIRFGEVGMCVCMYVCMCVCVCI